MKGPNQQQSCGAGTLQCVGRRAESSFNNLIISNNNLRLIKAKRGSEGKQMSGMEISHTVHTACNDAAEENRGGKERSAVV